MDSTRGLVHASQTLRIIATMAMANARKGKLNWACSSATYGICITTWITLLPLAIATNHGELPQSHCQSLMTMPHTRDDDVLDVKQ